MTRPLIYDEQFKSLIHSQIKEKFLFCFSVKVQSTAFYQNLSLQNAIRICSIYDFIIFIIIFYNSYNSINLINIIFMVCTCLFGIISMGLSNNLNKKYSQYYYYYRIIFLFMLPITEFYDYKNNHSCYYYDACNTFSFYLGYSLGIALINIYFAKIAWSFNIRLLLGHELLIIHGKYLEKILTNEKTEIITNQDYTTPFEQKNQMKILNNEQ
jgi:hypothetical protein